MRGEHHLLVQLHIAGVRDGADAEEQKSRADHLVPHPAPQCQVVAGVGPEDGRRVGGDSVAAPVVFIPDQRVPVD